MHLHFDASYEFKDNTHPQILMRQMGIKYQYSVPQAVCNCWWFFNCTNIPETLPEYLTELIIDVEACVGYGLSEEMADNILNWKGSND